ncbi:hypothetical protein P153DRAFT_368758 [Dothidotthia symphoricarpi CBS 119687]|uniref:Uncharacterized protein n=1 Tax=Dothidotthia symphoricarpi CBS 119687 TaxID=1392245 RepID=A0A6A6A7C9_9PLEO|nr:uncharacterized protein P153DRAFT_368758 [Dothidotthia symphoricarpi CBS 119687]KAF2126688.1 hypothetical protein P153DRAFT_368758 [Dothidotthia symphoricarpi CBS 119687]
MTTLLDVPGSNPPNPFSTPIQAILTSFSLSSASAPAPAPDETIEHLINIVTTSPDPATALWELWDAFFTAVVTSSASHVPHLAFLDAMRAQSPTQPNNVAPGSEAEGYLHSYIQADGKLHWPMLPRFRAQWCDVHGILEAWRDWDGVRTAGEGNNSTSSSPICNPAKYYLRICDFSIALLNATNGKGAVRPVWVFYACHNVLERKGPLSDGPRAHRMSPEQVWALDVRVAATWVRNGSRILWAMDQDELWRNNSAALEYKTELWPKEDGLTRERWQLWEERLRALSTDADLDEETRAVAGQAAEVIAELLGLSLT